MMAYLFIFVYSYLVIFDANTVPGSMRHWISVKLIVKEEGEEKYGGKRENDMTQRHGEISVHGDTEGYSYFPLCRDFAKLH